MAQFTSDGLSLAYDEFGPADAKKAIVLVHGFSANRYENWKRMGWYDAVAGKGMRGLALDCRGHGESAKPHKKTGRKPKRDATTRHPLCHWLHVHSLYCLQSLDGALFGFSRRCYSSTVAHPLLLILCCPSYPDCRAAGTRPGAGSKPRSKPARAETFKLRSRTKGEG